MQHLDEGTIHAWLDGALAPLEAEQVAKHAGECVVCAAAVAEARGIIAGSARIVSALDDVPGGVIPGRAPAPAMSVWRRLRLTPGRAALAATILLAVSATLTLRSSSPSLSSPDTAVSFVVPKPREAVAVAPSVGSVILDSVKAPAPSTHVVNAAAPPRKSSAGGPVAQPQTVAERREVADAAARRDTTTRELAKTRVAAQEPAAGATAAAAAPAPPMARSNFGAARMLEQRVAKGDSTSPFEGCYRLSADSSSGSVEMPRGLPTNFTLSRSSSDLVARRAANLRADSSAPVVTAWRQLSTTQANVTFGAGGARQVSLVLTAGSPMGVASSGDRTTTVRVARAACLP